MYKERKKFLVMTGWGVDINVCDAGKYYFRKSMVDRSS